jgi:TRAP-type C4-dicarboxylate transport system permease small subunit
MKASSNGSTCPLAWLRRMERWTAAGLVGIILALMAAQVVARYVFRSPIPWSEEVASFVFVWLAFLGGALVAGERKLLTVDVISPFLGARARLFLKCLNSSVVIACCLIMVVGSEPFIRRLAGIATPAADIPRRWWYLASAMGLSLIAVHTVANVTAALWRHPGDRDVPDDVPDESGQRSALP